MRHLESGPRLAKEFPVKRRSKLALALARRPCPPYPSLIDLYRELSRRERERESWKGENGKARWLHAALPASLLALALLASACASPSATRIHSRQASEPGEQLPRPLTLSWTCDSSSAPFLIVRTRDFKVWEEFVIASGDMRELQFLADGSCGFFSICTTNAGQAAWAIWRESIP